MTRRHVLAALVLSLLSVTSRGEAIDDLVRQQMAELHVPGVAVAVVRDGKPILERGYGVKNVEHAAPVTPQTVFRLASVTKQFTATGIMLLADEGKLSLEDKISRYVDGTPAAWQAVTIRHLLTHTSGVRSLN